MSQVSHNPDLEKFVTGWMSQTAQRFGLPEGRLAEAFHVVFTGRDGAVGQDRAILARYNSRLVAAHRVSSLRLDSWSLRSTFEACDSTVFTEMNSREPISR